jgi:hypothetical protein
MKKQELRSLIREELGKILHEGGPMDALGSVYGAFQTKKPTTTTTSKNEESFVITNGKEWYAGSKDYIKFAKHKSQSNLYPTYSSAQKVLFDEIPDNVVKEKQLKIKRFS